MSGLESTDDVFSPTKLSSFSSHLDLKYSQDESGFLCIECRAIDFNGVLDHMAGLGQAEVGDIVVQHRKGVDAECKLCMLLMGFVLPGTYSTAPEPDSDTPWQLRAFSIRSMLVDSRTQTLFRPATIALLHAGDGQRDYVETNSSERIEQIGYLAFGRTEELDDAISGKTKDETQLWCQTNFINEEYNPELIKYWLQYSKELDRDGAMVNSSEKDGNEDDDDSEEQSETDGEDDQDNGENPGEATSEATIDEFWEDISALMSGSEASTDDDAACGPFRFNAEMEDEVLRENEAPINIEGMTVIDCQTTEIVSRTQTMAYVALSYVWRLAHDDMVSLGHWRETQTGKSRLPALIPNVVHNAMQVTLDLGYRYLWVDQFCIDQGAAIDQIKEHISRMDLIYSSAELTVVAASSHGALPGVGSTKRSVQIHWTMTHPDEKLESPDREITIFNTPPLLYLMIKRQIWYSRGWCFQEALLSPRRLYFTDHQMLFESDDIQCCDTYPVPAYNVTSTLDDDFLDNPSLAWPMSWEDRLEQADSRGRHKLDDLRGRFQTEIHILFQLLKVYTAKDLTVDADSINGFAGALKVFSRNDPYFNTVMGLPIFKMARVLGEDDDKAYEKYTQFQAQSFADALGWSHTGTPARRPQFPSWSWAGWKGQVCWKRHTESFTSEPCLKVIAIENLLGERSDLAGSPNLKGARFIIGESVIVPRKSFLWDHIWSDLSPERSNEPSGKWHARPLYSGWWIRLDYTVEEQMMAQRIDEGRWSCLLLKKSLEMAGVVESATLLVVEWQAGDTQFSQGCGLQPLRTCERIGCLEILRPPTSNTKEDPFKTLPRVSIRLG